VALRQLDGNILAHTGLCYDRDVRDRDLQPGHQLQRQLLDRRVQLLRRHHQISRLSASGVEAARVLAQCDVPLRMHRTQDLSYLVRHRVPIRNQRTQVRGRSLRATETS
jgi:hypothetical protein